MKMMRKECAWVGGYGWEERREAGKEAIAIARVRGRQKERKQ